MDDVPKDLNGLKRAALSLHRYDALLETSRDIFIFTDDHSYIRYVSSSVEKVLGYRPDELLGRQSMELLSARDQEDAVQARQAWLDAPGIPMPFVRQLVHKDGSVRSFEGIAVNLLDDPQVLGFAFSLSDITEREQLRSRAFEMRRLEGIGRLAGGVAHDFNNILTVVLGQVELLESRSGEDARLLRGLSEIRSAADRATGLVAQLLAFARRSLVSPQALDLGPYLEHLRPTLEGLFPTTIRLHVALAEGLPSIVADPMQVEQVLLNLSANAKDAMPEGGRLSIACSILPAASARLGNELKQGDYVRMTVSDSGMGMDAITLDHAFEPFFTTKPSGKGSGMGLATCYGIVKQAGGHIEAFSKPGEGTRVEILWPMAPPSLRKPLASQAPRPGARVPRGHGELVLTVDDDAQVLTLIVEGLTDLGYRVQAFASPAAALAWVAQGARPNLLITDMVMPDIGGETLAGRIHGHAPALSVLYISGYAASAVAKQSWLKAGINFLPKPFALPDLAALVRRLLDESA